MPRSPDRRRTIAQTSESQRLQAILAARSVPCPRCAYDLRGSRGDRCPECGLRLTLTRLVGRRPLPVPGHTRAAMILQASLGLTLISSHYFADDTFGTIFCFGLLVLLSPLGWYGVWRLGSAESAKSDPWKLDVLCALAWVVAILTAVAAALVIIS